MSSIEEHAKALEEFKRKTRAINTAEQYRKGLNMANVNAHVYAFAGEDLVLVTIKTNMKEDVKKVLETLEPSRDNFVLGVPVPDRVRSPYRIDLENNINTLRVKITFEHDGHKITIDTSPSLFSEFLESTLRTPYETEYHYDRFQGLTRPEIAEQRIAAFQFQKTFQIVKWYGGNITLIDEDKIKDIIDHLKK